MPVFFEEPARVSAAVQHAKPAIVLASSRTLSTVRTRGGSLDDPGASSPHSPKRVNRRGSRSLSAHDIMIAAASAAAEDEAAGAEDDALRTGRGPGGLGGWRDAMDDDMTTVLPPVADALSAANGPLDNDSVTDAPGPTPTPTPPPRADSASPAAPSDEPTGASVPDANAGEELAATAPIASSRWPPVPQHRLANESPPPTSPPALCLAAAALSAAPPAASAAPAPPASANATASPEQPAAAAAAGRAAPARVASASAVLALDDGPRTLTPPPAAALRVPSFRATAPANHGPAAATPPPVAPAARRAAQRDVRLELPFMPAREVSVGSPLASAAAAASPAAVVVSAASPPAALRAVAPSSYLPLAATSGHTRAPSPLRSGSLLDATASPRSPAHVSSPPSRARATAPAPAPVRHAAPPPAPAPAPAPGVLERLANEASFTGMHRARAQAYWVRNGQGEVVADLRRQRYVCHNVARLVDDDALEGVLAALERNMGSPHTPSGGLGAGTVRWDPSGAPQAASMAAALRAELRRELERSPAPRVPHLPLASLAAEEQSEPPWLPRVALLPSPARDPGASRLSPPRPVVPTDGAAAPLAVRSLVGAASADSRTALRRQLQQQLDPRRGARGEYTTAGVLARAGLGATRAPLAYASVTDMREVRALASAAAACLMLQLTVRACVQSALAAARRVDGDTQHRDARGQQRLARSRSHAIATLTQLSTSLQTDAKRRYVRACPHHPPSRPHRRPASRQRTPASARPTSRRSSGAAAARPQLSATMPAAAPSLAALPAAVHVHALSHRAGYSGDSRGEGRDSMAGGVDSSSAVLADALHRSASAPAAALHPYPSPAEAAAAHQPPAALRRPPSAGKLARGLACKRPESAGAGKPVTDGAGTWELRAERIATHW